ncbi:MAG: 2-dehydropantoate 2-reductase [Spirochaetes bacterium]|nr:2-dehydropantoate 2-reductase [Spirochaetota bacterium]
MKLNILLIGSGAVGSYYAARLSQAGARVSVLCRSDYDIVKKQGINVTSVSGDYHFTPEAVISNAGEYGSQADYIIVATKVLPEINVPELIKPAVSPATAIVLLQNGIEIEEPVAAAFTDNEIISAIAFISVHRPEYGIIQHMDYGRIVLGMYPSGTSGKADALARLFRNAGVPCDVNPDIVSARWGKLMWNAPFNPISVLAGGATTAEMVESEPTRKVAVEVMKEIAALAEKAGHPIPVSTIDTIITDTKAMAPSKTSMLQDYERGRPLEVDAILGNTIRIAHRLQVPVPYCESLYGLLSLADSINRVKNRLR